MELQQKIIKHKKRNDFTLTVTFVLVANETLELPTPSLSPLGKKELSENISTIEYGLSCPRHGNGLPSDYSLKTTLSSQNIEQTGRQVTLCFDIKATGTAFPRTVIANGIRIIFEKEIAPALLGSDASDAERANESLRLARRDGEIKQEATP